MSFRTKTEPKWPVLLPSNTLHLRANDDRHATKTRCNRSTKGAWEGEPDAVHYTKRLCKVCFVDSRQARPHLPSLEQQIRDLWESRGFKVIEEEVWPEVHSGKKVWVWKVTAEEAIM